MQYVFLMFRKCLLIAKLTLSTVSTRYVFEEDVEKK